mmetsp:Transcript_23119/g.68192  ORF Transcript_23119/g.68192 Transcript_23119/m.68192 type:complete len:497 (-) Transcript_23119:326-1816(-)
MEKGGSSSTSLLRASPLDVSPACFSAIVDYLNERKLTPPDVKVDPPNAGEENKDYLRSLLCSLRMEDVLPSARSQISQGNQGEAVAEEWEKLKFGDFPSELKSRLIAQQQALAETKKKLSEEKNLFQQEKEALGFFVEGEAKDIVWLDVSGVLMATKRSTIGICEDSVLAKRFNDPLWARQESKDDQTAVDEWIPEKVESWAKDIKGVSRETSAILCRNEISGVHLLAMKREDFHHLGIKRGELAVLTNAIDELQQSNKPGPAFIEYSPYCFGKIIDQLRIAAQRSPDARPVFPRVEKHERKRFRTVVDYYFPGESAAVIMGDVETNILTPSHVDQVRDCLQEDGISSSFELLYRASRDGWQSNCFHSRCDGKGSTLTVVRSTGGFIFGGFADVPWSSSERYTSSAKAFLFTLQVHSGLAPTKMRLTQNHNCALYSDPSYGPTFGDRDLSICNSPNQNSCSLDIGYTYQLPNGQNSSFITGSSSFLVAELEVFRIF